MNEEEVTEEALKLPIEAQQRLVQRLQENCVGTDPEVKAGIVKKLEERRKAYLEGKTKLHSREESMRKLRETIDATLRQSSTN